MLRSYSVEHVLFHGQTQNVVPNSVSFSRGVKSFAKRRGDLTPKNVVKINTSREKVNRMN